LLAGFAVPACVLFLAPEALATFAGGVVFLAFVLFVVVMVSVPYFGE